MFARSLAAALTLFTASASGAHDFWLQPASQQIMPRAPFGVTFEVGHGPDRQRSPIAASRIIRFEGVAADGSRTDLRNRIHVGDTVGDATIGFERPGTYVVLLETDNRAESHLPAVRFNDYLNVEGLTPAIALRERTGRTGVDGAENYSRHAKTIVQIGRADARAQAQVIRPLGLELEIVPERSPQAAPRGAALPVRVFYRGRRLAGALVKLTDLAHDAHPVAMQRTDSSGRAVFAMPARGRWLLNVIWTRPSPRTNLTDFETSFSSLSFEIAE